MILLKLLNENMILVVNFVFLLVAFILMRIYFIKKLKYSKEYLSSIISLTNSHLHDASNMFNLIEFDLLDQKYQDASRACRGARFHFRSIFEELKNSQRLFDTSSILNFKLNDFEILYKKTKLNLKDLFDEEIFDIFDQQQLEITDKIKIDRPYIYANTNLLTKLFLNFIENSFKYSKQKVSLELNEDLLYYIVKIRTYQKELPSEIVSALLNNQKELLGHGFASAIDILEYQNAKLEISNYKDEGSYLYLKFKKYEDESLIKALEP